MTMTIDELKEICERMITNGKGHWPVIVAFEWKGDTVVSDIVSACQNGMTLQLIEEDINRRIHDKSR